jgi:hypothetical protein
MIFAPWDNSRRPYPSPQQPPWSGLLGYGRGLLDWTLGRPSAGSSPAEEPGADQISGDAQAPQEVVDADLLPDAADSEKFVYSEIGRMEGDRPDPMSLSRNPTVAGINPQTVRDLAPSIPSLVTDSRPDQLTPGQRAQVYRAYFDRELPDAFGHDTFDQTDHAGIAAFVGDTVFREGAAGKKMIQNAVNTVLADQRRRGIDVNDIKVDGRLGLESLYALNKIAQDGDDRQLFARDLKLRRDQLHADSDNWEGEALRSQHFYKLGSGKDPLQ